MTPAHFAVAAQYASKRAAIVLRTLSTNAGRSRRFMPVVAMGASQYRPMLQKMKPISCWTSPANTILSKEL